MNIKSQKVLFSILDLLVIVTDILALSCEALIIAFILSSRFNVEINPLIATFIPNEFATMSFFNLAWMALGCASITAFSIFIFTMQSFAEENRKKAARWSFIQRGIINITIAIIIALYVFGL